jgi:hypothetical protein
MEREAILPRRRRSKRVRPTTPTFLSLGEEPPPTKPVVYLNVEDGCQHMAHKFIGDAFL